MDPGYRSFPEPIPKLPRDRERLVTAGWLLFDKDIEKLRTALNDQRIVLLELDSYSKNPAKIDDKDIKKVFVDYGEREST